MIEAAIAAAKAGETFREFRTFDGTGKGEEVWTVSVLITPAGDDDENEDDALFAAGLGFDDMARWRMGAELLPARLGRRADSRLLDLRWWSTRTASPRRRSTTSASSR